MAHIDGINIHRADHAVARAHVTGNTTWLTLTFDESSGQSVTVSTFMDYGRAVRLAQAFNDAWPTPADDARDPVITWERPSCDRKDKGLRFGDGMRCDDVLPEICRCASPYRHPRNDKRCSACGGHIYGRPEADTTLAALNGDDTPPDAA